MTVQPMSGAIVTARNLQDFADSLPEWVDARAEAIVNERIPQLDKRAADIAADIAGRLIESRIAEAVTTVAAQVARDVAGVMAEQFAETRDADNLDAEAVRRDIVDAAATAITASLPALVDAVKAPTRSVVRRDRDGNIVSVESERA